MIDRVDEMREQIVNMFHEIIDDSVPDYPSAEEETSRFLSLIREQAQEIENPHPRMMTVHVPGGMGETIEIVAPLHTGFEECRTAILELLEGPCKSR